MKIRMLCLFDYATITGFATVSQNLIEQIQEHFAEKAGTELVIDIVAINYRGEKVIQKNNINYVSAVETDISQDYFGRVSFLRTLIANDYEYIFIIQDLGIICPMVKHLEKIKKDKIIANKVVFKSLFYFPVDSEINDNLIKGLDFFDYLFTYTEFGKEQISSRNEKLGRRVEVVYHGCNINDFHTIRNKDTIKSLREKYFGMDNQRKYIFANINRNQPRKDIPSTILGFLEYWKTNRNSLLYLHMDAEDTMGWNLYSIISQTPLKLGKDVIFEPKSMLEKGGATVTQLNEIYNSIDCYINTATGGGWELTATEAMACFKPVIVPKHTSFLTLGAENRAYYLEELYPIVSNVDNIIRHQSNIYEIAEVMAKVREQKDTEPQITMLENAYNFVNNLHWSHLAMNFIRKIK